MPELYLKFKDQYGQDIEISPTDYKLCYGPIPPFLLSGLYTISQTSDSSHTPTQITTTFTKSQPKQKPGEKKAVDVKIWLVITSNYSDMCNGGSGCIPGTFVMF